MRSEAEIREKLENARLKLRLWDGESPALKLLGRPPTWFLEQLRDQISFIEWVLEDPAPINTPEGESKPDGSGG